MRISLAGPSLNTCVLASWSVSIFRIFFGRWGFFYFILFFLIELNGQGTNGQSYYASTRPSQQINNSRFTIGAVLNDRENIVQFTGYVQNLHSGSMAMTFQSSTIHMYANPINTARRVCDILVRSEVYAVIVGEPDDDDDLGVASVSYTCGFYNIPVIGIRSRDKHVPPYSFQADMWIEMLKYLDYNIVVFIHSSDTDGRASYNRFVNGIDDTKIKIEALLEYEPGAKNIVEDLEKIFPKASSRVVLFYGSTKDAEEVFKASIKLNMTYPGICLAYDRASTKCLKCSKW
ncbi:Glutamate [NMDA] receptor subunit 1 [Nymphon striatum]|nr:Glutamate [NMDA] receptor subunit 1 [Nymphon striatum]